MGFIENALHPDRKRQENWQTFSRDVGGIFIPEALGYGLNVPRLFAGVTQFSAQVANASGQRLIRDRSRAPDLAQDVVPCNNLTGLLGQAHQNVYALRLQMTAALEPDQQTFCRPDFPFTQSKPLF